MIQGKTVSLRLAESGDAESIWNILSRPGALGWIAPNADEITKSNCFSALGWEQDKTARIYVIEADAMTVGVEVLGGIDWINRSAVIPCIIVTEHGRQYGVDATKTLVRHAFDSLGLHRISYASIHPEARKRADSLGAKFEGTDRQAIWKDNGWHDRHRFAFVKEG